MRCVAPACRASPTRCDGAAPARLRTADCAPPTAHRRPRTAGRRPCPSLFLPGCCSAGPPPGARPDMRGGRGCCPSGVSGPVHDPLRLRLFGPPSSSSLPVPAGWPGLPHAAAVRRSPAVRAPCAGSARCAAAFAPPAVAPRGRKRVRSGGPRGGEGGGDMWVTWGLPWPGRFDPLAAGSAAVARCGGKAGRHRGYGEMGLPGLAGRPTFSLTPEATRPDAPTPGELPAGAACPGSARGGGDPRPPGRSVPGQERPGAGRCPGSATPRGSTAGPAPPVPDHPGRHPPPAPAARAGPRRCRARPGRCPSTRCPSTATRPTRCP